MLSDKQKLIEELKAKQKAELEALENTLARQDEIEETLKGVLEEKNEETIKLTIDTLMPWIIKNSTHVSEEYFKELSKGFAKKNSPTNKAKSRPSYYLVNGESLKSESEEFYSELVCDKDVFSLEEDNNFIVVYSKNYAGKIKSVAEALGTKSGELYKKHATGIVTLEADHTTDLSKMLKSDFKEL
ncbi:hypothetical protein [Vibrio genomosp. F10]|uniref:hypothetical protein n=1 Tax=Vibrio genomosp. F10 TaxID=723171 RepID=UPI0002D6C331|nr:hypothetical protein [Vibrio genomosp. F10]OEF09530.1 hypothetical protein A1QI_13855 [Vibrio genomosp. F10 str. 9ZB36]